MMLQKIWNTRIRLDLAVLMLACFALAGYLLGGIH